MKSALIQKQKGVKSVNFFDLSSGEKKKVIKKAVMESTEEQVKLLKEYGYVFNMVR